MCLLFLFCHGHVSAVKDKYLSQKLKELFLKVVQKAQNKHRKVPGRGLRGWSRMAFTQDTTVPVWCVIRCKQFFLNLTHMAVVPKPNQSNLDMQWNDTQGAQQQTYCIQHRLFESRLCDIEGGELVVLLHQALKGFFKLLQYLKKEERATVHASFLL